jgi:hypothetical protein
MFQEEEPAAKYPPRTEPPGKLAPHRFDRSDVNTLAPGESPSYMGETFPAMCDFWLLTSEWTTLYYTAHSLPVISRVPVEFAHETFHKLLSWSDNLTTPLARGDKVFHHGMILQ